KAEVIRMGEYACRGREETRTYLTTKEHKHAEIEMQVEGALNNLDQHITDYLDKIPRKTISEMKSAKHTAIIDSVRDIERIDYDFENIIELIDYKISNKVVITEQANEDLNHMFELTIATVKQAVDALEEMDVEKALEVIQKEDEIDKL